MSKIQNVWLRVGQLHKADIMHPETVVAKTIAYCKEQGYDWTDITGHCRFMHLVEVRHMCIHFCYSHGLNYSDIGRIFGRNHATAIHACKKIDGYLEVDPTFRMKYKQFEYGIKESKTATE